MPISDCFESWCRRPCRVVTVLVLKKVLKKWQWCSLGMLAVGVALVQLSSKDKSTVVGPERSQLIGFSSALAACFISGFAGIYFEKVLKGSDISYQKEPKRSKMWTLNPEVSDLNPGHRINQ
ncbi:CMP-sialic acid transporter [Eumeta japonica]|uniref:CMP-sialic acid transporter n=1 Tax=Eumeta variegata TaxID=151549 RepID=A0A4C1XB60_EUMVA|nr:CMP-sialic acid transporter [Eumeta japonica]